MSSATKTRRRSITETHNRIAELGWEPTYHDPAVKYPTRYHFPKKAKDPMKHVMREYLPMELEKDERVFGGHDAAVRADMANNSSERWNEVLKAYIPVTNFAEVGAARCMSMLMEAVPNNELRNGYHVQFVDEVRHIGMQMALARWYTKHSRDPEGWNDINRILGRDPLTAAGYNMLSQFFVGDPIQCAFVLQIVAETALTNVAFVALPDVAARNGDFTLPTTYLSVQSDEARHISNGYATLLTVLQDDRNIPFIEEDLQAAWWVNHAYLDVFSGALMEYFSKDRSDPECYRDKWDRWIRDDWYRSYIVKLGKLGLDLPPEMFDRARERLMKGLTHKNAMFGFLAWPLHHWRFEAMDENDFEWFEERYPGWYDEYGDFWEAYGALADPDEQTLLLKGFLAEAPPFCWTCQLPALIDEDQCHRVVGDKTRFYCSPECRWVDETYPGRYQGDRNFLDRYHGWEISEVVQDLGFVREDGRTVMGQPHLNRGGDGNGNGPRMWTLDDLRASDVEIVSPNIRLAEELGLPSGNYYEPGIWYPPAVRPNGSANGHANGSGANGSKITQSNGAAAPAAG